MSPSKRAVQALEQSARTRYTDTGRQIKKALKEMQRKGLPISRRSLAVYADVARKTIYNHTELDADIDAAMTTRRPTPVASDAQAPSTVVTALRDQLRTQKRGYENTIRALKSEIKQLERDLASAHGEIHRLRTASPNRARANPPPQQGNVP